MSTRPLEPDELPELDHATLYAEVSAPRFRTGKAEWALVRYVGQPLGEVLPLRGEFITFGRAADNLVCLPEPEVSRHHARLDVVGCEGEGQVVRLVDLGSTNGTFVNGHRLVVPDAAVGLKPGDVIRMGSHAFKLKRLDPLERQFHEAMVAQSTLDPLTGLCNRTSVLAFLEKHVDLARRHRRVLSLILADLDHFKDVNDTHGHAAGDLVLRRFGDLLLRRLRGSDNVGRIGGEEFLVVLPETGGREASVVAEDLRRALELERFEFSGISTGFRADVLQVTGSFGVAELNDRDVSVGSLLARSDVALYRAKALGRNRVEFDGEP